MKSQMSNNIANEVTKEELNELVDGLKQWRIGLASETGPILSRKNFGNESDSTAKYQLKNLQFKRFLQWEKEIIGSINLGWTDDSTVKTAERVDRWFFTRDKGKDGPIQYGELIAIGNGKDPSFLDHKHRPVGIDMGFSSAPVYEWQILGGKLKEPVKAGDHVAIYNTEIKQPLIFFDRNVGGDIGWPTSERWEKQAIDYLSGNIWKIAKAAALAELGVVL